MIMVNELLASNIKRVRLVNRLSQKNMAVLIGTNQSTISSWERKVKEPDRKFIEKISDVFHIPVEALYSDDAYSYIWEMKVKEAEAICSDDVEKSNEKEEQEEPKPDTIAVSTVTRKGGMNMDKEVTFAIVFCLWVVARTLEFMKNKR